MVVKFGKEALKTDMGELDLKDDFGLFTDLYGL